MMNATRGFGKIKLFINLATVAAVQKDYYIFLLWIPWSVSQVLGGFRSYL